MAGDGGRSHHSAPEPSSMTSVVRPAAVSSVVILHVFSIAKLSKDSGSKPSSNEVCHPFCCWNKPRLSKWPFVLMSVMWTDSPSNSHSYWRWLWGVFLPVETAGGAHCDFSVCAFPSFLHLSFNSHLLQLVWCHLSHHLNRNSRLVCSLSRATDYSL